MQDEKLSQNKTYEYLKFISEKIDAFENNEVRFKASTFKRIVDRCEAVLKSYPKDEDALDYKSWIDENKEIYLPRGRSSKSRDNKAENAQDISSDNVHFENNSNNVNYSSVYIMLIFAAIIFVLRYIPLFNYDLMIIKGTLNLEQANAACSNIIASAVPQCSSIPVINSISWAVIGLLLLLSIIISIQNVSKK